MTVLLTCGHTLSDTVNPTDALRITVLMGGTNSESAVSLDSGKRVLEALESLGYRAGSVIYEGDLAATIQALRGHDLVFIALHGGDGEDGTVQAALEGARISFTGSGSQASRLAMDKKGAKDRMVAAGIATPPWVNLMLPGAPTGASIGLFPELTTFCDEHPYPLVVKPNHEGSTVGVSIVQTSTQLDAALSTVGVFGSQVLVEAYVPGRELTVTILDHRPLPIVEIVPKHAYYDYESKYTDGMSEYFVPAELPEPTTLAIQDAALRLYEVLGCRHYSRVDFRLNPAGEFFCLELNTLPGLTAHSLTPMAASAVDLDFNGLIDQIIKHALATGQAE